MALLITPILVSVGWIYSKPLTLDFNILEISVLGCAILIVNYLVAVCIINFHSITNFFFLNKKIIFKKILILLIG